MTPEADDLVKLALELHRLSLVIESAVRESDQGHHAEVVALVRSASRIAAQKAPPQPAPVQQALPPFGSKRAAALALYKPPFQFVHGYIYDADHRMVADQDGFEGAVHEHVAARVRGWGRIGYLPDAAALQDEVGAVVADALTAFWLASPPHSDAIKEPQHG